MPPNNYAYLTVCPCITACKITVEIARAATPALVHALERRMQKRRKYYEIGDDEVRRWIESRRKREGWILVAGRQYLPAAPVVMGVAASKTGGGGKG